MPSKTRAPATATAHRGRVRTDRAERASTSPSKLTVRNAIVVVVAVALVACVAGIGNDFAQDDLHLIQDNARVHSLASWREIITTPFWPPPFSPDLYRPLTALVLAAEYAFGAGAPLIFRVASYLLYAGAAVAVFLLLTRISSRRAALAGAVIFAAHPVHVEAIALGVSQSELLVGLLSTLAVLRYVDARRADTLDVKRWIELSVLYAAAALAKEQGLVLPVILLAAELFVLPRSNERRAGKLLPGYVALGLIGIAILAARRAVLGGLGGTFTAEALVGLSMPERALTMLRVVPEWIRLLVWPAHLQADYSPREIVGSHHFGAPELVGAVLLLTVLDLAWVVRKRAPAITFGLAWCAIALVPVSNVLVPTGIVLAERTLFLPSIGFVIAIAGAIDALLPLASARWSIATQIASAACVLVVGAGVARSIERQLVWRNDGYLVARTVSDAPTSFRARRAFADALYNAEQPDLANAQYQQAIELAPAGLQWRVRNDFARRLRDRGERAREAEQLRASLHEEPAQEDTRGYLVAADLAIANYAEAAQQADSAIAHGAPRDIFTRLHTLADSAARISAPAGSIKVGINTGDTRPAR